jgi:hypothetical protein
MWPWPSSRCRPAATAAPVAAEADAPPEPAVHGLLDLVTIIYGGEIPLLRLEARSIARFLDPEGVGAILVVVNDRDEEACVAKVRAMLPDYGPFADRVEILRPDDLFALRPAGFRARGPWARARAAFTAHRARYPFGVKGGWRGNRGWSVQQALKLAVARHGSGSHLLILDAKNHFVRPVSRATFVAPDGRALARLALPNAKHARWNAVSFRMLGVTPPGPGELSPPTVTPFVIRRSDLLASLEAVEARVGPVESFFARKRSEESEFALIHAAVAGSPGGVAGAFAPGLQHAATIRPKHDDALVDELLSLVEAGEMDVLSVHKRRLGKFDAGQLARLKAIWEKAGLDASELLAAGGGRRDGAKAG